MAELPIRLLDSKYVLGEELGRGPSDGVRMYRALNQGGGSQFVAIKEIPLVGMSAAGACAVESEVELLRNLSHPQIIRFYEMIRTEHHLYLVLECVENGSLASILKTFGRLTEHMLIVYMRQVLAGLEWLRAQGVCHRDIRGANLLITKDGQVKLANFGVAVRVDASAAEQAGAPVGTPYWMAPEVILQQDWLDLQSVTKADIWSLGCTVLELLTGEPPYFELRPVNALYRTVHDTDPPIPETVRTGSPLLNDFLLRCFDRDPKTRASASALRLHEWLQQEMSPSHINMPPPVLADGRRESGAAASARLAVLESIDKDSRPPSVEPSPRESRAPVQGVMAEPAAACSSVTPQSDGVRQSGYLWKKGSSWLSSSYRRRLVYLRQDELCFVPPPASPAAGLCSALAPPASSSASSSSPPAAGPGASCGGGSLEVSWAQSTAQETLWASAAAATAAAIADAKRTKAEQRIPLGTILKVRVHSQAKFEFELVCASRRTSCRLRATSAEELAVWVTTISAAWCEALQREANASGDFVAGEVSSAQAGGDDSGGDSDAGD